MQAHGLTARIEIVLNVIVWNWVASGLLALMCLLVIIYNFLTAWREISASVYAVLRTADRDSALMAFAFFRMGVVAAAMMATSLGYGPPHALYRSDVGFCVIAFLFCFIVWCFNAFIILCFAMRFADDSWLKEPFHL
jgi:hypothetical protein